MNIFYGNDYYHRDLFKSIIFPHIIYSNEGHDCIFTRKDLFEYSFHAYRTAEPFDLPRRHCPSTGVSHSMEHTVVLDYFQTSSGAFLFG